MNYNEPTQNNVSIGDELITRVDGIVYTIPISGIGENAVRTKDFLLTDEKSVICTCPYSQAVIITKDRDILKGKNIDTSLIKYTIPPK
jgi:hypothetical protein